MLLIGGIKLHCSVTIRILSIRFLLCNQAMLPPPTISCCQHSSASQSSVPMEEGEEPSEVDGAESLTESGSEERVKLTKVLSTEDEVARLTIEVCSIL